MKIFDRIWDTTITTGTGNITLAGAVTGYRAFSAVLVDGDTFPYCISGQTGGDWETGMGIYISGSNSFSRSVLQSSNGNALVNFGSGTKDVRLDILSSSFVQSRDNAIINGDMTVWQMGTSFAAVSTSAYTGDRYQFAFVSTAVVTISRDTDVPTFAQSGHLSNYSLKIDVTTADAAIAAGDYVYLLHKVEGHNFLRLAQRPMTLSFWVKAVKSGIYCVAFRNSVNDRSYVAEYTVNSASTWEKKTVTVPASPSAGTWNYTNGIGLEIGFPLAAGTTFHTTANAWQTGNYLATANQVNGVDDAANNFWLSQIKLEAGEVATLFESGSFEEELAACQRYYQKSFEYATAPAQNAGRLGMYAWRLAIAGASGSFSDSWRFPVPMRTSPTMTWYNPSAANAFVRNLSLSTDATATSAGSDNTADIYQHQQTGLAAWAVNNYLGVHWTASAEL